MKCTKILIPIVYCLPLFLLFSHLNAQNKTSKRQVTVLVKELNKNYNNQTGLWETTSWWNAANALTAIIKYGQLTKNDSLQSLVKNTFLKTKEFEVPESDEKQSWICKNYINDYYDDEGWWALAWLDAWEWTGEDEYLQMSKTIFLDISKGWDEKCGGGIYWKKGLSGKSTISNILTMALAARLHKIAPETVGNRSYLEWALSIWNWIESSKIINKAGQVQDGISAKNTDCQINPRVWTYNQGVILSGLVYLSQITSDPHYVKMAHQIASATLGFMIDENGVLIEKNCEPDNCNGDAKQFKGVFMRHLAVLNQYDPKDQYKIFIHLNSQSIWEKSMKHGTQAPGVSWSTYLEDSNGATMSSALDAMNSALELEL